MVKYETIDEKIIGKEIILNAVKMEASLAELLRMEVKILKKKTKENYNFDDIQNLNKAIKNIILTLMILDERIQTGIDLINK